MLGAASNAFTNPSVAGRSANQSSARQQCPDRFGVGGQGKPRGDVIQTILHLACGCRGSVESEVQHGDGERADCGNERPVVVRRAEADAEQPEIGEGILQQGVVAFELFDERLLLADRCRKSIDCCCRHCIHCSGLTQPVERLAQAAYLTHQWIVVSQQASACREDIPVERGFQNRKLIECRQGPIE
jgi:hypothetical protein